MTTARILRIAAALAVLVSGVIHLDLYFNYQYRFAGDVPNFGRSLILNAVASGVVAVALMARDDWFVRLAGIGFAASTIAVFAYTHSEHTFLGFSASGFEPSPQAQWAVIVEVAAIVLLAATFLPALAVDEQPVALPAIGGAAAVAALVLVGVTVRWQPDDTPAVTTAPTTTVSPTTVSPPTATTLPAASNTATTAGTSTNSAAASTSGADAVTIANFAFSPNGLSIRKGTTVTWTNDDTTTHSVVATDTSFVSENLNKGDMFQHTFDTDGTFTYVCGIHNSMKGTITVTG